MADITVESGTSSTAVGPGQTRDEAWTTTLRLGATNASLGLCTPSGYGWNNSSKLQYTLMFCDSATPKMLCTGALTTCRTITLSCCSTP